ncbi:MAG: hypothetical protein VB062_04655 [Christensenella sp.]|nr:hypothetical protein [Christensenella sp.]
MTNAELSRLYHLNRDIERIQERIDELESAAESVTASITGMPGGGTISDKVASGAVEITAMKLRLGAAKLDALAEQCRLTAYIEDIPDPLMRQIMHYRHVSGYGWEQVAAHIGGGMSGESCRKAHYRYLNP